jgi:hypothetical protein
MATKTPVNPKPSISSVIAPAADGRSVGQKIRAVSTEYHPHQTLTITPAQIAPGGKLDVAQLCRLLTQLQSNSTQATLPARTNPLGVVNIVRGIALQPGTQTVSVQHGLNQDWTGALPVNNTCGGVLVSDAGTSTNRDTTGVLKLYAASNSGTVDILFFAS